MNIFFLDKNPVSCAKYHCDQHVIKMIIEYAQILSTAHRVLDGNKYITLSKNGRKVNRWNLSSDLDYYLATHINHPSNKWVRLSKENYLWLYNLWVELCKEYTNRYNKVHATYSKLYKSLSLVPKNIPNINYIELSEEYQAMSEKYRNSDPIIAYRNFYINEKPFVKWKHEKPFWFCNNILRTA